VKILLGPGFNLCVIDVGFEVNKEAVRQVFLRTISFPLIIIIRECSIYDRICGLVVRDLDYRSGGPGSIPGTTRKKSSWSETGSTQPREYN
jgi:hypothetical protein